MLFLQVLLIQMLILSVRTQTRMLTYKDCSPSPPSSTILVLPTPSALRGIISRLPAEQSKISRNAKNLPQTIFITTTISLVWVIGGQNCQNFGISSVTATDARTLLSLEHSLMLWCVRSVSKEGWFLSTWTLDLSGCAVLVMGARHLRMSWWSLLIGGISLTQHPSMTSKYSWNFFRRHWRCLIRTIITT